MFGLSMIEVISFFSLIFAVLNGFFALDTGVSLGNWMFIWVIGVNITSIRIKKLYVKYGTCITLLLSPLFLARRTNDIIFIAGVTFLSILFHYKELEKYNYGEFLGGFTKGLLTLFVTVLIIIFTFNWRIGSIIAPYIIIYLLSSISALRTLRLREYIGDGKPVSRLNIRYSVLILLFSFVLSIENVRNMIFHFLGNILGLVSAVAAWILTGIGYLLSPVLEYILKFMKYIMSKGKLPKALVDTGGDLIDKRQPKPHRINVEILINTKYFKIAAAIIATIIIFYIIIRLLRKGYKREVKLEYYNEEKELIVKSKGTGGGLLKMLSSAIRPKDNNEYIRFYYIKFLKLCIKNKIDINKSDTSLEVNKKGEGSFDNEILSSIRNIYIRARYGMEKLDEADRNNFIEDFKRARKQNK